MGNARGRRRILVYHSIFYVDVCHAVFELRTADVAEAREWVCAGCCARYRMRTGRNRDQGWA